MGRVDMAKYKKKQIDKKEVPARPYNHAKNILPDDQYCSHSEDINSTINLLPLKVAEDSIALINGEQTSGLILKLQEFRGNTYVQHILKQDSVENSNNQTDNQKDADEIISRVASEKGGGYLLGSEARDRMETLLGYDFSNVHIHTDTIADELTESLDARAFTSGKDVFFKEGEYKPDNINGKKLLSHELTHVMQQDNESCSAITRITNPSEIAENEADDIEHGFCNASISRMAEGTIARQVDSRSSSELSTGDIEPSLRGQIPIGRPIRDQVRLQTTPSSEIPQLSCWTVEQAQRLIEQGAKQYAIDTILTQVQYTTMPNISQCVGQTMMYDPATARRDGATIPTYHPDTNTVSDIEVRIYDNAFRNLPWLYSTMMHEYRHVCQLLENPRLFNNVPMLEFMAYSYSIAHAQDTGVEADEERVKDLGCQMHRQGWILLTPEEQTKNQTTYNDAIDRIRALTGDENWVPH